MDVSISARHVNITPRLEEVIHEKIGGLDRFLQGLDHAEVHFDEARNPRITDKEFCEVVVEGHGHHLRCKVHAPDPFSAVDAATLKLERQIRKLRTRLQRRHRRGRILRHGLRYPVGLPREPAGDEFCDAVYGRRYIDGCRRGQRDRHGPAAGRHGR